ncbi:MAG: hypothetical protein E4G99_04645 [Anaerolineales bacterium]|nr:MAG: hypothetical protein E4G99_04645 [Anaerolineales bacterium]
MALKQSGVVYEYVDIRKDEAGRWRVMEINAGNESVPTLVFADGSTLTEPSNAALQVRLESLGYGLTPSTSWDRLRLQLQNPTIIAFGIGLTIGGGIVGSLLMVILGVALILVPWVVRRLRK